MRMEQWIKEEIISFESHDEGQELITKAWMARDGAIEREK